MTELRTAIRGLARERAFTAAVLVTLALGIGVCLTMFGVVRAVLLEPLPFPNSERLVALWMTNPRQGFDHDVVSYPQLRDWRDQSRDLFDGMAAYSTQTGSLTVGGAARELRVAEVTDEFFAVLGGAPVVGRPLVSDDFVPGRHRAIVLSEPLWRGAFAADPTIVGRTITYNTEPFTVVGVLPAAMAYPPDTDAWTPLAPLPERRTLFESRGNLWLTALGRLKSGVSLAAAQDRLVAVQRRMLEIHPDSTPGASVLVRGLHEDLTAATARPVWLLQGAVVLVFLIACANVSNLVLARASARTRETATRIALGAGWRRVMADGLVETLLLAGGGAALGLLIAAWLMDLVRNAAPSQVPRIASTTLDPWVFAAAAGLSMLTALVAGAGPIVHAMRTDAAVALKTGGRTQDRAGGSARVRLLLVGAQIALALVLLVGSGLLIKSFARLLALDPGYRANGALTGTVTLPAERYRDSPSRTAAWNEILRRVSALPGVRATGAVTAVLFGRIPAASTMRAEGRDDLPDEVKARPVLVASATPGYFEAIGHALVSGRAIDERDATATAPPIVVVNESLARTYFGRDDIVGRRVTFSDASEPNPVWFTIVGVVKDVRRAAVGPELEARPEVYIPHSQRSRSSMTLVVRGDGDAMALAGSIRAAIAGFDADVPFARVRSLEELLSARLEQRRFLMALATAFAVMAVLLSAIGIYGVVSFAVSRRLHEFGIHLALGATRRTVMRIVLRQGFAVAFGGAVGGAIGGAVVSRIVASQLYDVSPTDPGVFAVVAMFLVATTLVACWLPARRAARVDPMKALRE